MIKKLHGHHIKGKTDLDIFLVFGKFQIITVPSKSDKSIGTFCRAGHPYYDSRERVILSLMLRKQTKTMCHAGQEFVGGNDIVSCLLLFLSLVSFHILTPSPVSSLLLLSPVSSSVSSYLTSIVSSLPSFVLCLLSPISFSCLPSHISSELG